MLYFALSGKSLVQLFYIIEHTLNFFKILHRRPKSFQGYLNQFCHFWVNSVVIFWIYNSCFNFRYLFFYFRIYFIDSGMFLILSPQWGLYLNLAYSMPKVPCKSISFACNDCSFVWQWLIKSSSVFRSFFFVL